MGDARQAPRWLGRPIPGKKLRHACRLAPAAVGLPATSQAIGPQGPCVLRPRPPPLEPPQLGRRLPHRALPALHLAPARGAGIAQPPLMDLVACQAIGGRDEVADPALLPLANEMAVLLSLGPGAVLSHRSAAALWGLAVAKPDAAPGVRVTHIYSGAAAAAAGLRVGDRLLTLDDRWTDTVNDCYEAAAFVKPGQTVTLKIVRAGKEMEISVSPQPGL